jgi:hypothetical protein
VTSNLKTDQTTVLRQDHQSLLVELHKVSPRRGSGCLRHPMAQAWRLRSFLPEGAADDHDGMKFTGSMPGGRMMFSGKQDSQSVRGRRMVLTKLIPT